MERFTSTTALHISAVDATKIGEQRVVKNTAGLTRSLVSYHVFRVVPAEPDAQPWLICKGPAQLEALAEALPLEIFVPLPRPPQALPRSPRTLLTKTVSPWDYGSEEYLQALLLVPGIAKCLSFVTFFSSNVVPTETEPFWKSQARRHGWIMKKKGDRNKLQRRFVVIKWKTLYYFESDKDLTPLGSIRLDLVAVEHYKAAKGVPGPSTGFTLIGGKKAHPRTFLCDTPAETDRWVSEIRAVMAAHEKETAVHGTLRVRVLEGRNLSTRDLSGLANPYWSAYLESQVVTSMTVMRTLNPTWPLTPPSVFETSSNRKFLICVLWDAPSVVGDPTCLGEISVPISELAKKRVYDMWVPLTPQHWRQEAGGELHLMLEYDFAADRRVAEADSKATAGAFATMALVIAHFRANPQLLKTEGLFRVPGRALAIQALHEQAAGGQQPDFSQEDAHNVGGLLKMLLRDLPTPIFPFETFDKVVALDIAPNKTDWVPRLRDIVQQDVSEAARVALAQLLRFLREVAQHEGDNRMSVPNLAMVFGPAILRCEDDTPAYLFVLPRINNAMMGMLAMVDLLFPSAATAAE